MTVSYTHLDVYKRQIVGRYKAVIRTISGVYSSESKNDSDFHRACELAEKFAKKEMCIRDRLGKALTDGFLCQ